jgi:hypothetical protein
MEMHTPSKWTFWLSLALVVLAIVSELVNIPFVSKYALWVAVVGYVVLVIGCTVKTIEITTGARTGLCRALDLHTQDRWHSAIGSSLGWSDRHPCPSRNSAVVEKGRSEQ